MLRGIFMAPHVPQAAVDFYVDLFKKVRDTPEWKEYMQRGAYNQTFMSGQQFKDWLAKAEQQHESLMREAHFIAKQ
jgi:tripartite-type tricarboxylate transporter receptor subunit TctC